MSKTDEVIKLINDGVSNKEILRKTSCSKQLISQIRSKLDMRIRDDSKSESCQSQFNNGEVEYETELRDYTEIHINEMGFNQPELNIFFDENDQNGKEYMMPIGRADLIFIDKEENFYIFEFKRNTDSDKVVGQILRYMGYIRQNIAENKVFGFIVTNKINDKIKYAASEIPNISLFEYNLNITVNQV